MQSARAIPQSFSWPVKQPQTLRSTMKPKASVVDCRGRWPRLGHGRLLGHGSRAHLMMVIASDVRIALLCAL